MKSRPWINQWRIHLLGLITHEALHVSTPTCPGSWEKEKHLSTKLCPSTFSFSLCEKQLTFEDKLTQEHREDPPHGHSTQGKWRTLPANHHHHPPPFFPSLLLVDLWPYLWRGWDKWKERNAQWPSNLRSVRGREASRVNVQLWLHCGTH